MTGEFVTLGHLGGYFSGGDPASWYPSLWEWAVSTLGVETMIDVGCGDGAALDWFLEKGVDAYGIDGVEQDHERIVLHDFTTGPFQGQEKVDLVWSCEFVEHVEEEYMENFLASFKLGRWVMMTHALPAQGGWHHVNCKPMEYWVDVMKTIGYSIHHELTESARSLASLNTNPDNYFIRSGLVFRRDE